MSNDREGWPIERLAAIEHERWADWQRHAFNQCHFNADGTATIPAWAVERWTRQIQTPYADLSETEKEADRREVRRYLAALHATPAATQGSRKDYEALRQLRNAACKAWRHDLTRQQALDLLHELKSMAQDSYKAQPTQGREAELREAARQVYEREIAMGHTCPEKSDTSLVIAEVKAGYECRICRLGRALATPKPVEAPAQTGSDDVFCDNCGRAPGLASVRRCHKCAEPDHAPKPEATTDAWQPIETAPKDGSLVIVPGGVARWGGDCWLTVTGEPYPGRPIEWPVKVWRPLPPAPKEQRP